MMAYNSNTMRNPSLYLSLVWGVVPARGEPPQRGAWQHSRPLSPEWPAAAPVLAVSETCVFLHLYIQHHAPMSAIVTTSYLSRAV